MFANEIYDKIQQNYWEKISDQELSEIFRMAGQKIKNQEIKLESEDKKGVDKMIMSLLENKDDAAKKESIALLTDMVLANLKPFARSRLYSLKEEKSLVDTVNNVNRSNDYFSTLGVTKEATDEEIEKSYTKSEKTPEIKQAYKVLKDNVTRKIYETSGVEPTMDYKLITPKIFYIHMTKFSPTSLDDLARVTAKVNSGDKLDTLIFDMRGNIGGSIDILPYFLGPFIGMDNYAYQFYQQGKKEDFKTKLGWMDTLVRYKKVVILIDENSQSTAELAAAVFKKYNVGVVMGTTSKGWGTVERVIPIDNQIADGEKFSMFLVHHLTLRDDGQPIEGLGVEPMISIKSKTWKKELLQRFNDVEIVKAVEEIYKTN